MTEASKGYLNDLLSLVENVSQQATDTLDKKGAAYCAAYVVTDLLGIKLAHGKNGKLGYIVSKPIV